jgi:protein arginine N-methyltransferase 2
MNYSQLPHRSIRTFKEHVIIEGHPGCIGWMKHNGWYKKPGVRILEGRWQDFLQLPPEDEHERRTCEKNRAIFKLRAYDQKKRTPDSEELTSPECDSEGPIDLGKFDIVYFDTFEEGYPGHFTFIKHVPRLLRGPTSRFSYFNGHSVMQMTPYKVCYILCHPTRLPLPIPNRYMQKFNGCITMT